MSYRRVKSCLHNGQVILDIDNRLLADRGLSPNSNPVCAAAHLVAKMQNNPTNKIVIERVANGKVSKCRFNGQAIAIAVLNIIKDPSRVECLRVYQYKQSVDIKIGAAKIDGYPAFRWCGENALPDSAGSSSVIFAGDCEAIHPVYVAAKIAQKLYKVRDIRRVTSAI